MDSLSILGAYRWVYWSPILPSTINPSSPVNCSQCFPTRLTRHFWRFALNSAPPPGNSRKAIAFCWVYPSPGCSTLIDSILPSSANIGVATQPKPYPFCSSTTTSGGELYPLPGFSTKISAIAPSTTTGFNWASSPKDKLIDGCLT